METNDNPTQRVIEKLLADKARFWKTEEINDLLGNFALSDKDVLVILNKLADDPYVFRWLDFISSRLQQVASEDGFIDLLRKTITKIKGDMAQGSFIRALINVGENNSELGVRLYKAMIENADTDLVYYASFPLGGSGRARFETILPFISEGMREDDASVKASCLRALRVIFENSTQLRETDKILHWLEQSSSVQEDIIVQIEALGAYFDFSTDNSIYEECVKQLKNLAERESSQIRFRIADLLWLRNLGDKNDEADLLSSCAKDENLNVLSRVAVALSEKGKDFPERSLKIIKSWILRDKYMDISQIDYCLTRIGGHELEKCLREIETWIEDNEEGQKIRYFVPIVLQKVSSQDYPYLIAHIKDWPTRGKSYWYVTLHTIERVLTEVTSSQNEVIDPCYQLLVKMANEKALKIAEILGDEADKFYQCFRLIEALQFERKELNFSKLSKSLDTYQAIKSFIGNDWFAKMQMEKNTTHPLLHLLSNSLIDEETVSKRIEAMKKESDPLTREVQLSFLLNSIRPKAFLEYLNQQIAQLAEKTTDLSDLKKNLRNPDQFWEAVSEIEVIAAFSSYLMNVAPKIGPKKLDLSVNLDGEPVFIEVINPKMFKPLRYMQGKAIGIENRAKGKIYAEFKSHLKDLESSTNDKRIVIVIDIGRSEIDYDFVEDYLFGTLQLTMRVDKTTGKVVDEYTSRSPDSMHSLDEKTDVLCAVICYKGNMGRDLKFHREGKIILNPHARNPLAEKTIKLIESSLLV